LKTCNRTDFIKNNKADPYTKFYLWLEMIRIHYLATDRPYFIKRGEGNYRRRNIHPVSIHSIMPLRYYKYEKTIIPSESWANSFNEIFWSAFKTFTKVKFDNTKSKEFLETCNRSLNVRVESNIFLTILRPENLDYFQLKEKMKREDASSLAKASWYKTENKLELKKERIRDINDFFPKESYLEVHDIFAGYEDKIRELGFEDKQHMYDELRYLVDTFKVPKINS